MTIVKVLAVQAQPTTLVEVCAAFVAQAANADVIWPNAAITISPLSATVASSARSFKTRR